MVFLDTKVALYFSLFCELLVSIFFLGPNKLVHLRYCFLLLLLLFKYSFPATTFSHPTHSHLLLSILLPLVLRYC